MYVNSPINRVGFNPFAPQTMVSLPTDRSIALQEAIVVDVIVNDTHPEYAADGYNIGAIKIRALASDKFRDTSLLNWALPLEQNFSEYPLLGEIVLVLVALNRFYYMRKINVSSRVTQHALPGLNTENSSIQGVEDKNTNYIAASNGHQQKIDNSTTDPLGTLFTENINVYRLRHDEGDIIWEGRSGQSIRLGAAWTANTQFKSTTADQMPNLLMRIGPDPKAKLSVSSSYALVTEDINKDMSSLWMVTDQVVNLTYATVNSKNIHQASITNFPTKLEGNQIIINTDRLVLNTKSGKIMGFALDGIHWTSSKDFSVDADQDYVSKLTRDQTVTIGRDKIFAIGRNYTMTIGGDWQITTGDFMQSTAKNRHSFVAPKNYLGSQNEESQPIPCGAELASFLNKFLEIIINNASSGVLITSSPGKSSAFSPIMIAQLSALASDVANGAQASFNSTNSYTVK